jgi:hypothetical protein
MADCDWTGLPLEEATRATRQNGGRPVRVVLVPGSVKLPPVTSCTENAVTVACPPKAMSALVRLVQVDARAGDAMMAVAVQPRSRLSLNAAVFGVRSNFIGFLLVSAGQRRWGAGGGQYGRRMSMLYRNSFVTMLIRHAPVARGAKTGGGRFSGRRCCGHDQGAALRDCALLSARWFNRS